MTLMVQLAALVIALAILLGGGTHQGFLGDIIVQLGAVALLVAGLWQLAAREDHPGAGFGSGLAIIAAFIATGVVQVIPLPAAIVPGLAGFPAQVPAGAPQLDGVQWSTLSLTPQATLAALVSALPPIAVFVSVGQMTMPSRQFLARVIVGLGFISLLLGLGQLAQGAGSALRFYEITNPTHPVGFFANRNHFAGLLYVAILLAAPTVIMAARELFDRRSGGEWTSVRFVVACAIVIGLTGGLIAALSRAGVLLGFVALIAIAVMTLSSRGPARMGTSMDPHPRRRRLTAGRLVVGLIVCLVAFGFVFGLQRVLPQFNKSVADDLRIPILMTTLEAARAHLPFGTGLGSFVPVFAAHEPVTEIFSAFANRAHNDFAELALEYGVAGIAIMAAGVVWLLRRGIEVWFGHDGGRTEAGTILQKACWTALVLMLIHALAEYGLRTTALSTIFAFCGAVLIPAGEPSSSPEAARDRVVQSDPEPMPAGTTAPSPRPARPAPGDPGKPRWQDDRNWPDDWR